MQAPFHSPLLAMLGRDNGTIAAPRADDFGLRRRHGAGNQRFMPMGPFSTPAGGYDSGGINPGGMYNGSFQHPRMPGQMPAQRQFQANPGGFSLAHLFGRY